MNEFVVRHKHPELGELTLKCYVTQAGEARLTSIYRWLGAQHVYCGLRMLKGKYAPYGRHDNVEHPLLEFANSVEARRVMTAELRRLATLFGKAANKLALEALHEAVEKALP